MKSSLLKKAPPSAAGVSRSKTGFQVSPPPKPPTARLVPLFGNPPEEGAVSQHQTLKPMSKFCVKRKGSIDLFISTRQLSGNFEYNLQQPDQITQTTVFLLVDLFG